MPRRRYMQGSTSILRITARFFQIGVLAFLGAIIVHTLVMVAEFYLVERIELNIRNDFLGAIISMPMLPMLVALATSLSAAAAT